MALVQTINGPIEPSELGRVLMHEHLFTHDPELEENYPHPEWNEDSLFASSRLSLKELKAKGISTLVDLTVMGLGRQIPVIQRLLEGVDMNVVVATGYYTYKDLPQYFQLHGPGLLIDDGEDPLGRMFRGDIVDGIAGTGVKAGIIKIASDRYGMTDDVQRIFRAAARVHLETGAPITTHTSAKERGGLAQQELLEREGVDLSRVVIGHCGDTTDLVYLRTLMDQGSTIGMDRFGIDVFLPLEERIKTVVALCREDYADRMVLSHDAGFFSSNVEVSFRKKWAPLWSHSLVSDRVLPELSECGVTDDQIHQMMVINPMRLLAGRPPVGADRSDLTRAV